MKKLLTIIATAFMAISVSAQSEAGSLTWKPNVGFTISSVTGADKDVEADRGAAVGLTAGVEAMYMISEKFGAALGLNYTGYNIKFKEQKGVIASNYYFNIPVTVNYYVVPGLALKAGLALNVLSSAKVDGKDKEEIFTAQHMPDGSTLNVTQKYKDDYESTFFSVPVGASYEINNFVFDARYSFGVSAVGKGSDGSLNSFSFTVGYKF